MKIAEKCFIKLRNKIDFNGANNMEKITPIDKAFYELWKSGHRFISEEEKDSMQHGLYYKKFGKVSGYTINGLKQFAKLDLDGENLSQEEIEIMFNYIKFRRMNKG